jgi:hypothetical protein
LIQVKNKKTTNINLTCCFEEQKQLLTFSFEKKIYVAKEKKELRRFQTKNNKY